jgi:hypothetical protein
MEKIENWKYYPRVLQALYLILVIYVGAVAIVLLVDPKLGLSFAGFPSEGIPYPASLVAGVAYSQWLAIALISVLGLRSPYKYSPILLLVVTYKTVWILALALPGAIAGTLIPYGQITAIEWGVIVIIYASLMPWKYILAKSK